MAYNGPCLDNSVYWLLILFQSPSGYDSWQRKEFSHIANLLKKFWQSAFPPLGNNYKQNQRGILEDYTTLLHKLLRLIIHTHSNIHFLTLLQFVFLKKEVFGYFWGAFIKGFDSYQNWMVWTVFVCQVWISIQSGGRVTCPWLVLSIVISICPLIEGIWTQIWHCKNLVAKRT